MSVERIWAGWRSAYVASVEAPPATGGNPGTCVFCGLAGSEDDEAALVVHRGPTCMVLLNAYPYTTGHMLVMPKRHVSRLDDLDREEFDELWTATAAAIGAVERAYGPDGVNMGANLGRAAGAGLPDHVHMHVLPRWVGDTNFMTAVADVRVMPEALPATWRRLVAAWASPQ